MLTARNIVVNATDTVTLTCTADDRVSSTFNFTWFFEEEAVGSSVVVTSVNQSTSMASISSISESDFGMYSCQATNRAGSVNVTTSVREMGKLQCFSLVVCWKQFHSIGSVYSVYKLLSSMIFPSQTPLKCTIRVPISCVCRFHIIHW